MKKIALAALALVAATGIALAAVTSANTVGFVTVTAEADVYTPVAVMFADVGQNTLSIDSIVFEGIARDDSLQIFGNDGNVATEIFRTKNGWEDQDGEDAGEWVFQPGDSFWVTPANGDDIVVKFPGEVKATDLTIIAPADVYTPFGNGTPKAVSIADITFDGIARDDSLQIFGNDGNVATELFRTKSGWEDQDGEDASDYIFQPGEAFWISPANGDDVTVTIPAAL